MMCSRSCFILIMKQLPTGQNKYREQPIHIFNLHWKLLILFGCNHEDFYYFNNYFHIKIMSGFDSSIILPVLSLILIFFLTIKIFVTKASEQNFPPGPRPLPIIGNLHILNLKRPYQTMLEVKKINRCSFYTYL